MRPVCHSEAPILEAHDLLGGLVLPDRRKQLPERSPLLLLRLAAQLRWCVVGDFDDDGVVGDGSGDGDVGGGGDGGGGDGVLVMVVVLLAMVALVVAVAVRRGAR